MTFERRSLAQRERQERERHTREVQQAAAAAADNREVGSSHDIASLSDAVQRPMTQFERRSLGQRRRRERERRERKAVQDGQIILPHSHEEHGFLGRPSMDIDWHHAPDPHPAPANHLTPVPAVLPHVPPTDIRPARAAEQQDHIPIAPAVAKPALPPPPPPCHVPFELPLARRPYTEPQARHDLGRMNVICEHCRAYHWKDERVSSSSN